MGAAHITFNVTSHTSLSRTLRHVLVTFTTIKGPGEKDYLGWYHISRWKSEVVRV